jgi:hypothetical protein
MTRARFMVTGTERRIAASSNLSGKMQKQVHPALRETLNRSASPGALQLPGKAPLSCASIRFVPS